MGSAQSSQTPVGRAIEALCEIGVARGPHTAPRLQDCGQGGPYTTDIESLR